MKKYIFSGSIEQSNIETKVKDMAIHIKNDNRELWLSYDYWLHPDPITCRYKEEKLPKALEALMDEWTVKAEKHRHTQVDWYEKNAALKFIWWEKFYVVDGSAFGLTAEQFCGFSFEMERDLDRLGCPFNRYTGTID